MSLQIAPGKRAATEMQTSDLIRRRNLPHWDVPTAAYFVTTCLEGSIPAQGLLKLQSYRAKLARRPRPSNQTEEEWKTTRWKLAFARTDLWLDRAEATRSLADQRLAQIVVDALHFFAGKRYDLLGYVVMPSHLHWVFQPLDEWVGSLTVAKRLSTPRQRIVHSIDRYTASRCNQVRGQTGSFWQREPYDHWIRGPQDLERILLYIDANPVKAGHVQSPKDWRYSSAWERHERRLELGQPL
jgi:putative transposase